MSAVEVITSAVEEFAKTRMQITSRAAAVVVETDEQAESANKLLKEMREASADLEKERTGMKASVLETGRKIDAFFNPKIEMLDTSVKFVKAKIQLFLDKKEEARKAEEARLREAADKERRRIEDEARRKEEAAARERAKAEAEARALREAAEEKERQRIAAEKKGDTAKAAQLAGEVASATEKAKTVEQKGEAKAASMETAASDSRQVAAAVQSAPSVPKTSVPKGFSSSTRYNAEVTNLLELVKAIAEGKAPVNLVQVNQTALRQRATADREQFNLPGCKLVVTKV